MKNKPIIPSVDDLARLTPQELADLLSNIVLLLRHFPEIPIAEITTGSGDQDGQQPAQPLDASALVARMRKDTAQAGQADVPEWAK